MPKKKIGITGHQSIPEKAVDYIRSNLAKIIAESGKDIICYSSLATGADQIFAEEVLLAECQLNVIIPSAKYRETFSEESVLINFENLISRATEVEQLDYKEPSEEAFFKAGCAIVDKADVLLAVWDGLKAQGKGGTADIVNYSRNKDKEVIVIWPAGVKR